MTTDPHLLDWLERTLDSDHEVHVAHTARGYEIALTAMGRYINGKVWTAATMRDAFAQAMAENTKQHASR